MKIKASPTPEQQLAAFFERNGYFRLPNPLRQEREGHQVYKKGYEVRLVAYSKRELQLIRRLLRQADFSLVKPHEKYLRWVQPVYGREAVERFCEFSGRKLEFYTGKNT
jgi:hypothetical protein